MSVNEEEEFIKQNKGFTQVEPKLDEKWTDLQQRFNKAEWKFVADDKFQDIKFFKDKKWNADKIVAYLLYSRDNLIRSDNVKLYKVDEYGHPKFQKVKELKSLSIDQQIAYFANCIQGVKVDTNAKMRFLVKGGQPVKGLPNDDPTPTAAPVGKRGRKQDDSKGEDDNEEEGEVVPSPHPTAQKKKKEVKGPLVNLGTLPEVLLATMLDVDPALFTQEWFDALSVDQRAALLGIFIKMEGNHMVVFLTGSQEAKFVEWKRLLEEARKHDLAFGQAEQEQEKVKEKKRARSSESSESSESEDLMETAFIEEGATWEEVKVKFPGVMLLPDIAQMSDHDKARYSKARSDLKDALSKNNTGLARVHAKTLLKAMYKAKGQEELARVLNADTKSALNSKQGRKLTAELQRVTKKAAKLDRRTGSNNSRGGGRGRGGFRSGGGRGRFHSGIKCYKCEQFGHRADACPNRAPPPDARGSFYHQGGRGAGRGGGRGRGH
jgi:hypothetical protein